MHLDCNRNQLSGLIYSNHYREQDCKIPVCTQQHGVSLVTLPKAVPQSPSPQDNAQTPCGRTQWTGQKSREIGHLNVRLNIRSNVKHRALSVWNWTTFSWSVRLAWYPKHTEHCSKKLLHCDGSPVNLSRQELNELVNLAEVAWAMNVSEMLLVSWVTHSLSSHRHCCCSLRESLLDPPATSVGCGGIYCQMSSRWVDKKATWAYWSRRNTKCKTKCKGKVISEIGV